MLSGFHKGSKLSLVTENLAARSESEDKRLVIISFPLLLLFAAQRVGIKLVRSNQHSPTRGDLRQQRTRFPGAN